MSLLVVCIALTVGVIIGATERTAIINEMRLGEMAIHARLKEIQDALKGKIE